MPGKLHIYDIPFAIDIEEDIWDYLSETLKSLPKPKEQLAVAEERSKEKDRRKKSDKEILWEKLKSSDETICDVRWNLYIPIPGIEELYVYGWIDTCTKKKYIGNDIYGFGIMKWDHEHERWERGRFYLDPKRNDEHINEFNEFPQHNFIPTSGFVYKGHRISDLPEKENKFLGEIGEFEFNLHEAFKNYHNDYDMSKNPHIFGMKDNDGNWMF